MDSTCRDVSPGPSPRHVRTADGRVVAVPKGWVLVPPGDAALTRRVKAAGPSFAVKEKKGRRTFSRGVWAEGRVVASIRAALAQERADPAYARKLDAGRRRRAAEQEQYVDDFHAAIVRFLDFDARHRVLAADVAAAITNHAAGVGSGTVARTKRIPIERRAEAATIAWLRHRTTGYDDMKIARVKGRRREVRRELAQRSRELLDNYRRGEAIAPGLCLLTLALREA